MAAPTTAEVKIFLAIPATLTLYDPTIAAQITEADAAVKDDGIQDGHPQHKRLVTLKTAVQIAASPLSSLIKTNETNTSGGTGDLKREKIADVETEFFNDKDSSNSSSAAGGSVQAWPGGNYERDYLKLLNNNIEQDYKFGDPD